MLTKPPLLVMFAALPTSGICKIHRNLVPHPPAFLSTQLTNTLKLFVGYDLNFKERAQTLVPSRLQAHRLEGTNARKSYWKRHPRTRSLAFDLAIARFTP